MENYEFENKKGFLENRKTSIISIAVAIVLGIVTTVLGVKMYKAKGKVTATAEEKTTT